MPGILLNSGCYHSKDYRDTGYDMASLSHDRMTFTCGGTMWISLLTVEIKTKTGQV